MERDAGRDSRLRRGRLGATLLLGALLLGRAAEGQGESGFLRGAGGLDLVIARHQDEFPERLDLGLGRSADGEVRRASWSLYAAYGATDELDLTFSLTYAAAEARGAVSAPDERDLQDLALAAKWRLGEWESGGGAWSLLLAPGIKLPVSDYETKGFTSLGSGQVDLRARLIGHVQGRRGGWYASVETGYDRRNGAPADELPFNATLGANLARFVWVTPFYSRTIRRAGGPEDLGGFAGDEDFTRYGLGLYVPLTDHLGLTTEWRRSDDGRARGEIDGYSLGIVLKL